MLYIHKINYGQREAAKATIELKKTKKTWDIVYGCSVTIKYNMMYCDTNCREAGDMCI